MKLRIIDRLGVLFDPRFWLRLFPVDHEWSDELEALLDMGEPARTLTPWRAQIGKLFLWKATFPYAFGQKVSDTGAYILAIPRRRVALRLHRAIKEGLDEHAPDPRPLALPTGLAVGAVSVADRRVAGQGGKPWTEKTTHWKTP